MRLGDEAPALDDGVEWLDRIKPHVHARRPSLIHFWSTGCPLCHEGARLVNQLRTVHRDNLDVIAVFAPRPEATSVDIEAVRRDAQDMMRLNHPCVVDRHRELQTAFECPYAPGYFIFDRDGKLRHRQMGNASLESLIPLIDRLVVKASHSPEA